MHIAIVNSGGYARGPRYGIASHLGLPKWWIFEATGVPGLDDLRVTIHVSAEGQRLWAKSVRVDAQGAAARVSGTFLRRVPVDSLMEASAAHVAAQIEEIPSASKAIRAVAAQSPVAEEVRTAARERQGRGRRLDEAFLATVADIYNSGLLAGQPTLAVEKALDAPRSSVNRWVREARRRGLIPSDDTAVNNKTGKGPNA